MKIFCLPYAGGTSSIYAPWKNENSKLTVIPLDLPGHGTNISMPLLHSFERNLDFLYQKISEELVYKDDDYYIFGHSLGGFFAYELCKRLERSQFRNPTNIFVSGCKPPLLREKYDLSSQANIKQILKDYGATPPEILDNDEIFSFFQPIILNDFLVFNDYKETDFSKISTPGYIFYGIDDDVSIDELLNWQDYFINKILFFPFDGGHFFITENNREVFSTINNLIKEEVNNK
ncbi:thioesterase II family protein [Lactococcus lactis]|uniref:thioesterase II family protein n=1 Tax=Lactococcus lactis TaxID=1358 RepID=UPI00117B0E72|nr:alpha/beta fold hydrolase [Lactococcus lactis]TRW68977.1 thioesterase [Lactococcus lactis]